MSEAPRGARRTIARERADDIPRRNVIQAKLAAPGLPRTMAARPRLAELLRGCLAAHRVVVLAGTAGSGKTSAVVEALRNSGPPVAWVTVDPGAW